jgi:hypothetical protein
MKDRVFWAYHLIRDQLWILGPTCGRHNWIRFLLDSKNRLYKKFTNRGTYYVDKTLPEQNTWWTQFECWNNINYRSPLRSCRCHWSLYALSCERSEEGWNIPNSLAAASLFQMIFFALIKLTPSWSLKYAAYPHGTTSCKGLRPRAYFSSGTSINSSFPQRWLVYGTVLSTIFQMNDRSQSAGTFSISLFDWSHSCSTDPTS